MSTIDLRSDTSTLPPREMLDLMREAKLGNDGYHEDPTTNELESLAASMLGKEAGVFVASGTMGNLVSLMSYLEHGQSFIVEENAHMIRNERGYSEVLRARPVTVESHLGSIAARTLEKSFENRPSSSARIRLICTENTHGYYGGTVIPTDNASEVYECAHRFGLPVHLDGSRIFNAATYLGVEVKEVSRYADSVMFCLSKGLCAPIGSIVAGTADFADKVRERRKILGGGMRQSGVIAAGGVWALENMVKRLAFDHKHASILALGLTELGVDGFSLNLKTVQTNIVLFRINHAGTNAVQLSKKLADFGIKVGVRDEKTIRLVTHNDVSENDIYFVLDVFKKVLKEYS